MKSLGVMRPPTFSLSLKSKKRSLSSLGTVEDTMPKRKRATPTKPFSSDNLLVSPSKKQTLITNFYESPTKSQESCDRSELDRTPVKSHVQPGISSNNFSRAYGTSRRSITSSLNTSESKENEIIVIHDSQSQSCNSSLINTSISSVKSNSDVIVIDDSQSINGSFNKSDITLDFPDNSQNKSLENASLSSNDYNEANLRKKILSPKKCSEINRSNVKKPDELLTDKALPLRPLAKTAKKSLKLTMLKTPNKSSEIIKSLSPKKLNINGARLEKTTEKSHDQPGLSITLINGHENGKPSKSHPISDLIIIEDQRLINESFGSLDELSVNGRRNFCQAGPSKKASVSVELNESALPTNILSPNKNTLNGKCHDLPGPSKTSFKPHETQRKSTKKNPKASGRKKNSNVASSQIKGDANSLSNSSILPIMNNSDIIIIEDSQSTYGSSNRSYNSSKNVSVSGKNNLNSANSSKETSAHLELIESMPSIEIVSPKKQNENKGIRLKKPEDLLSEEVLIQKLELITPTKPSKSNKKVTPNKSSTPRKSPKKSTPKKAKLSTPEKNKEVDLNIEGATFSPKIRRRPNKYFDKDSMPEGLNASPSKSVTPNKNKSPRKRNLMKELNAESNQCKLDRFIATGSLRCENLLDDDMNIFSGVKDATWKATLDLINDPEAMENIRRANATTTTSPSKPRRNTVISEDSTDHIIFYLLNNPMISCAFDRGVFTTEECGLMLKAFRNLKPPCQRLYAKLFERTLSWFRVDNDLVKRYSDVYGDVRGLIQTLIQEDFITNDLSEEEPLTLLKLLQVGELKIVCKHFNIKLSDGSSMNKDNLVKAVLNHACSQKTLFGDLTTKIKQRVIKELGQCVKLKNTYNHMFNLLVILATYPYHQDEEKKRYGELVNRLNLLKINKLTFPAYTFRPDVAFADLQHLSRYADSLTFVAEYSSFVERKDWVSAAHKVIKAKTIFTELLSQPENQELISRLGGHLMKFTAGYQLSYCLHDGINVLKKELKWVDDCTEVITILLSQNIYQQKKRGIWYDELALLHQTRKKDLVTACETVIAGLNDPKVDIIRKKDLCQRGAALLKRKSTAISAELRQRLNSLVTSFAQFSPVTNTITAMSHEGVAGRKQVFVKKRVDSVEYSSVEEIVIDHYKNQAILSYKNGMHDEGRTIMNLVLACFYDIIYSHPEGDSMFHCQMQRHPLDWGGHHFYIRRRHLIQDLLDRLRMGGINEIMTDLQRLVSQAEDVTSVVNWDYIRLEKLEKIQELLECLKVEVFLKIAEHVIKDYKTYHSGFPDLILWDPPTSRCMLVEVKGPNDKLSPSQTVWLENLTNFGANAIVCHVENVGTTKRRAS